MDRLTALRNALPSVVRLAGLLARYCDHAEHNEPNDRSTVIQAGLELRRLAMSLFTAFALDPLTTYAARLERVEARYPLSDSGQFDAVRSVPNARTWRKLQQAQAQHDHVYHGDVVGMPKADQLRHYTLHVAKLAWLMQEAAEDPAFVDEFAANRLPDMLLFGIKLATVMGEILDDQSIVHEPE